MDPAVYQFYERLNQNPEDAEALFYLWEYHGGRAEFQQLATIVEQTAARRTDPRSAADLFYRAGELWAKNVGRADKAVGNYKRAFDLDPAQLPALAAARIIYQQLGNARSAAQLLERELASTADMAVRAMLLREGAALRAQLNDLPGQIAYLEETARTSPDDWEVLRELATAYLARGASADAHEDDNVRAAQILAGLAQSMGIEHGLAFAEAALDAYPGDENAYSIVHHEYLQTGRGDDLAVRQIAFLTANPTSPLAGDIRRNLANLYLSVGQAEDAIACLQPLGAEDPEVARVLAGLYRQTGRGSELAEVLQALAPSTEPPQRIRDLRDLAEIFGQQGNRTAMLGAMRDVLALDPADPEALALIEDDLRARGAYGELRDVLWGAVRAEHCPVELRLPRLREIAQVSAQRLDDRATAVDAWRELLSYDAGDTEALGALEHLLAAGEQWDELAAVLDHRAGTESDTEVRREVLRRLATLHRSHRSDGEGEAHALSALLEIDPDDDNVTARLAEVRGALGDAEGAAEVLRARAERATDDVAVQRWTDLAIQRTASGALKDAVEAWQQVVAREPGNEPAWESLESTLGAAGRHTEQFEALSARARALPEGAARAAIHARAAAAAQAMGDAAGAITEAERAVAMSPDDPELTRGLLDLLEANGERDRLLAYVTGRAEAMPDGPQRIELYRRAAHAVGQTDPQAAAAVWHTLRACAARTDARDDAEALDALLGLAELADDGPGQAGLLAEAAAFATEPAHRRDFLLRRAALQAGPLEQRDEAIETLQGVLRDVDPGHAPTWATLAELAHAAGRNDLAAEALERQVGALTDDDARAEAAGKLVALTENEIRRPEAVIHALEVHHAADPGDYGVVQRLADLCESEGRHADAVRYLELLAEIEGDDDEASKLAQHIAAIAEDKLGDPRKAWEVLLPAAQSGDAGALERLMALASRHGMDAEAVPVLSDVAGRVIDRTLRGSLWRDIAGRRGGILADPSGSLDAWVEALRAQPTETSPLDAVDALAAAVAAGGARGQRVADGYRSALEACTDPTGAHELAIRGLAAVESTGDAGHALDLALYALGRAPADDDLLDAVVRLAPGLARNDDVYLAFDKRRRAAQTDAERFGVTVRAVRVAAAALADRDTAFQYMDQAISQAIGRKEPDETMLDALESTGREADQTRPECGLVSGIVERYATLSNDASEDNPRVAAVLLRRAGALCDADLGLMDHTLALYTRAVSLWPAETHGAELLEAASTRARKLSDVVDLYEQVIADAYEASVARTYIGRRAALLGDQLGRVDEALHALQRLVEIAPRDLDAIHALQNLLERHCRWQQLLMALEREVEAGGDRVAVSRRIAGVWETRLRNVYEAREAWKRVLKLSPGDPDAAAALERLERRPSRVDVEDLDDLHDAVRGAPDAADARVVPDVPDATSGQAPEEHPPASSPVDAFTDQGSPELPLAAHRPSEIPMSETAEHAPGEHLATEADGAVEISAEFLPATGEHATEEASPAFDRAAARATDIDLPPAAMQPPGDLAGDLAGGVLPEDPRAALFDHPAEHHDALAVPVEQPAREAWHADVAASADVSAVLDLVVPRGHGAQKSPREPVGGNGADHPHEDLAGALGELDASDVETADPSDLLDDVEPADDDVPSLDNLAALTAAPSSHRPAAAMTPPPPPPLSGRPGAPPPLPPRRRE